MRLQFLEAAGRVMVPGHSTLASSWRGSQHGGLLLLAQLLGKRRWREKKEREGKRKIERGEKREERGKEKERDRHREEKERERQEKEGAGEEKGHRRKERVSPLWKLLA